METSPSEEVPVRAPGSPGSHLAEVVQVLAGGVILAAFLLVLLGGNFSAARPLFLGAMLVAGSAWLVGLWTARRGVGRLWVIVSLALVMRLVALGSDMGLSDDLWRYAWEGGLVLEGKSPYAAAPEAPELTAEREAWAGIFERMNNTEISAAYPPVTQYFAAAVVWLACGSAGALSPTDSSIEASTALPRVPDAVARVERFLRVGFALADLLVLWPLVALLRRRGLGDGLALAWAWSPLVVLEFAGSAHFDSLGILLLVGAVWALAQGTGGAQRSFGAFLLGLAFLTKYLPLLAAPYLLVRRRLAHALLAVGVFGASVGLGFYSISSLHGGLRGVFAGLGEYGLRWESWNLVYRYVEPLFDSLGPRSEGFVDPRRLGRLVVGGLLAWLLLRWFLRRVETTRAIFWALGAFLILTPTLHPWYLTWILPFAALAPRGTARAWWWLAAVSPLLYWPLVEWQARGEWLEPAWSWPLVALPFFLLLGTDLARREHCEA